MPHTLVEVRHAMKKTYYMFYFLWKKKWHCGGTIYADDYEKAVKHAQEMFHYFSGINGIKFIKKNGSL